MRVVLVDLSAKYIHSGLALKYLKAACEKSFPQTTIVEETINRPIDKIIEAIYRENPQVVGFSCYIWNISTVLKITGTLKKVLPDTKIILGGPEVSYTPREILENNKSIDYIVCGEGETAFIKLLQNINQDIDSNILGVATKANPSNGLTIPIDNLNNLPNPYENIEKEALENKIVYYECSRGCPFRCSYCLSGLAGSLRFLDIERVKEEIFELVINKKVKQIKFVDRTFNHNKDYAYKVVKFLKKLDCETNFHFEIRADLLDQKFLDLVSEAPMGRFQFEIGIQTTNRKTLKAINRNDNWEKVVKNTQIVKQFNNIHQHLDLIAGLPYEDLCSFKNSFNDVYGLKPDMLQLGFLKVLKGSQIWLEKSNHDYKNTTYPPYEVLSSSEISFDDILELKGVEHVLELFYNSGNFKYTLEHIVRNDSYKFYKSLSEYFVDNELDQRNHSLFNQFEILHKFFEKHYEESLDVLKELLKLDFLVHFMHRSLPDCLNHIEIDNYKQTSELLLKNAAIKNNLSDLLKDKTEREILKHTHFELFPINIPLLISSKEELWEESLILFDYSKQNSNFFNKKANFISATEFLN